MLSDLMVRQAKAIGKPYTLADTDGLSLFVSATDAKAWHFRFSWDGKRDLMSFCTYRCFHMARPCDPPALPR